MPSATRGLRAGIAASVALALTVSACGSNREAFGPRVATAPPRADAGGTTAPRSPAPLRPVATVRIRVTTPAGTRIVTLALEEYVLGTVRAELPPKTLQEEAASRALQVQALVSRTYAVANIGRHASEGFDLCDTTHCQLYRAAVGVEGPHDRAARAVAATRGEVITYEGRVIQALFHSNCGGHTTSAGAVWGGPDEPYLRPVTDEFCARSSPGAWTFTVADADLRRALDADPRTDVGARLQRVDVTSRDASGRAALVALVGSRSPLVRAEEFRYVLRHAFGQRSLKSTLFTVAHRNGQFEFTGTGFGHGVGLCQVGATLRARAGQSPLAIITHYFPGTTIQSALTSRLMAPRPSFGLNIP